MSCVLILLDLCHIEPDHWKRDITPAEHAKDFMILSEILSEVKPLGTMMAGPDVADSMEYFAEYVNLDYV